MSPALGVVADDLTGATDLAEQVWRAGRSATVLVGLPSDENLVPALGGADGAGCVVVALKNRSAPPAEAAGESGRAARVLLARGAEVLYQKYCSTFDSTPEGNIGPIGDAVAAELGRAHGGRVRSVGTPATPSVGRTVLDGRLHVHGELLEHTSMAHHPRTPMADSRVAELLRPQTRRPVVVVDRATVGRGPAAVAAAVAAAPPDAYLLCDAEDEAGLDVLAAALALGTSPGGVALHGGAGLAAAVARRAGGRPQAPRPGGGGIGGRRLVVSGSLSAATRAQHDAFRGPRVVVDASRDADGETARVLDSLRGAWATSDGPALVTSWDGRPPGPVDPDVADRTERVLAAVAARAVAEVGVGGVVVAGGETSGAVVDALGVRELRLVRSVAPGLVWCEALRAGGGAVALLLKSGNFGAPTLFEDAWEGTA